jgi:hypothetical protein
MTQPYLFEVETPAAAAKPRRTGRRRAVVASVGVVAATSTPGVWTITFPAPAKLMSVNTVKHWRVTSPVKKAWREAMYVHAKAAKLPTGLRRVRVDVELRFPSAGRRDAPNYHPYVVKPLVDALGPAREYVIRKGRQAGTTVREPGYGLIADDTAEYLDGPFVRLGTPARDRAMPFGQVVVTITDLSAEVAA